MVLSERGIFLWYIGARALRSVGKPQGSVDVIEELPSPEDFWRRHEVHVVGQMLQCGDKIIGLLLLWQSSNVWDIVQLQTLPSLMQSLWGQRWQVWHVVCDSHPSSCYGQLGPLTECAGGYPMIS